jgi:phenylpropionate dioxygenase-like ring-hydroxylating dioxygenase large terminal subunit
MFAPLKGTRWCVGTRHHKKNVSLFNNKHLGIYNDRVLDNVCPHRGARLSNGTINNEGNISCPYHGWEFNQMGRLVNIPSCDSLPLWSDVKSYDTHELYDFVWTSFDDKPCPEPPRVPQFHEPEWNWVSDDTSVRGNWLKWVENSTDISHINFVHDFADEKRGQVLNMRITEDTSNHTTCEADVFPKAASPLTQHMQTPVSHVKVTFYYPNLTVIHVKLRDPYEFITYITVTPRDLNNSLLTWCFGYKVSIPDNFFLRNIFFDQMIKTILEDEDIIKNIPQNFHNQVNVPVDMLSRKVVRNIIRDTESSSTVFHLR